MSVPPIRPNLFPIKQESDNKRKDNSQTQHSNVLLYPRENSNQLPVSGAIFNSEQFALFKNTMNDLSRTIQGKIDLKNDYGYSFVENVGEDQFYRLPIQNIETKDKDIKDSNEKFQLLNQTLRGKFNQKYPFLVLKLAFLGSNKQDIIDMVTEIVYNDPVKPKNELRGKRKRISENQDENHLVAFPQTQGVMGETYKSCLYQTGVLQKEEMVAIRDLLAGQIIVPPYSPKADVKFIRLAVT